MHVVADNRMRVDRGDDVRSEVARVRSGEAYAANARNLRGFDHVKIVASGGIDEYEILRLNPVVDSYGGLDTLVAPTASAYDAWRAAEAEHARVLAASRDRDARLDLVTFQLGELDKAAPKPNEDEELASLRQVLAVGCRALVIPEQVTVPNAASAFD